MEQFTSVRKLKYRRPELHPCRLCRTQPFAHQEKAKERSSSNLMMGYAILVGADFLSRNDARDPSCDLFFDTSRPEVFTPIQSGTIDWFYIE
jgi:hypothetical protein